MLKIFSFVFTIIGLLTVTITNAQWTPLLDKDLSQWDTYLSYRFEPGYDGSVPTDQNGNTVPPIGKNPEGYDVFTVTKKNNELLLNVSGEIYGCVFTKKEYDNYHFRLKIKWGEKKYDPRKNLLRDSGILYHSIGSLGAEHWRSWMLSQEFQIMEGHMGDFWSQANSAIDIRAYIPEYIMNPVADESQPFISLGTDEDIQGFCLRSVNYEKPHGEWNTLELVCFKGKSLHIVNGQVVMILKNSRYVEDGKKIPLEKGKIQLQSESAELYYKNIEIRELKSLPEKYARYF